MYFEMHFLSAILVSIRHLFQGISAAGMINVGNSCFINATLQSLLHISMLLDYLKNDAVNNHVVQCGNRDTCTICPFIQTMIDHERSQAVVPVLVDAMSNINPNFLPGFTGFQQQDAHEYLG